MRYCERCECTSPFRHLAASQCVTSLLARVNTALEAYTRKLTAVDSIAYLKELLKHVESPATTCSDPAWGVWLEEEAKNQQAVEELRKSMSGGKLAIYDGKEHAVLAEVKLGEDMSQPLSFIPIRKGVAGYAKIFDSNGVFVHELPVRETPAPNALVMGSTPAVP